MSLNDIKISKVCRRYKISWTFRFSKTFCARAQKILSPMPEKHDRFLEFSRRCEIQRAPRARVRARQKFFWKCNFHDKISLRIFLFGHNSKSEFFRAIWSLKFFFENLIFSKKFEKLKILKMPNITLKVLLILCWKHLMASITLLIGSLVLGVGIWRENLIEWQHIS